MIITDYFVWLHIPKTGGTSTMKVLDELNHRKLLQRNETYESATYANIVCGHNYSSQIPPHFRHMDILSNIRNPFDWYVSFYEYEYRYNLDYRNYYDWDLVNNLFPDWNQLSFPRFLEFTTEIDVKSVVKKFINVDLKVDIGLFTLYFIAFYYKDPIKVIRNLSPAFFEGKNMLDGMNEVTFLRMEHLNEDLYHTLLRYNYEAKELAFILEHQKENVGENRKNRPWQSYYNSALLEKVRYEDRLFFNFFTEYESCGI